MREKTRNCNCWS